jgi:hypothetical protein
MKSAEAPAAAARAPASTPALDGFDESGCRGHIHPVRPHERLDERAAAGSEAGRIAYGLGKLPGVLVERRCDGEQPAVDVLQVLEVQRAFLLTGEFLGQTVNTGLPTMPDSISALVFTPTTATL